MREVARLYARSRASIIFWGMGVSQHVHGTDNARCLIALALVTGQIGRPGTGLHPLRGQNNVQGASDAGLIPIVYPDYQRVEKPAVRELFERAWAMPLDPQRGLTVVEIMDAAHAGRIRGLYIMGENPAMSDPDLQHAREALAALDHLVVQDLFLTETAFHADVVLPASAFAEKAGTFTNTDRRVQLARPVVPPPGDARQDLWIVQEIARRIGLDWAYGGPRDVFAEMAGLMPSFCEHHLGAAGARGRRHLSGRRPDRPGNEIIFAAGFPTESGRARIVPADLSPPDEVPDARLPDDPFDRADPRTLAYRFHDSPLGRARRSRTGFLRAGLAARVSPGSMFRRALSVRLETRRGNLDVKLRADRDVPDNMVFMPFCYAEAAANLLTNPALDPFGKIPEFKFCAVRVT